MGVARLLSLSLPPPPTPVPRSTCCTARPLRYGHPSSNIGATLPSLTPSIRTASTAAQPAIVPPPPLASFSLVSLCFMNERHFAQTGRVAISLPSRPQYCRPSHPDARCSSELELLLVLHRNVQLDLLSWRYISGFVRMVRVSAEPGSACQVLASLNDNGQRDAAPAPAARARALKSMEPAARSAARP